MNFPRANPFVPTALIPTLVIALFGARAGQLQAADSAPANPPVAASLPTLYVCGDSTAASGRAPIQGWGQEIGEYFDPAKLRVENRARGGRSARTFIAEGLWNDVRSRLHAGDVVLLQFGHNDTKMALSIERYDLAGTGDEVEVATDSRTGAKTEIRTFGHYLHQMIADAKTAGASVVVLSSVPRSRWSGGKIVRGEEEHARWAAEVAKADIVPFVDVNALIADVYDPIGSARIKALYFPSDNTHTNAAGARVSAACVVTGLARLALPPITAGLKPDAAKTAAQVIADVAHAASTVKLALPLASAFPAPNATQVCPDTVLRLTFSSRPKLGGSGRIHITDTATGQEVDTIDVGAPVATKSIGGEPNYRYFPVILSDTEAAIYPRNGTLAYGKTYTVAIDPGVFKDGDEAYVGTDAGAWKFTTKAAGPAPGATKLTVAADGSGDFCTVQGAIDFVPEGNTTPTTITIKKGTYTEIIFFTNKHALTFVGEDRRQTVIAYATNDRFNPTSGNPFGDPKPNPSAARVGGHIYHRGVFLAHRVNDLVLANLTIRNTTPQGGSQAEAIILNGTTTARAILRDVDLYSYQDTLQINGQAFLSGCAIEGDIDFMWGTGPCLFENCTCRSLRSGAYYTQIRNPGTNHGYVYLNCAFEGAKGVMGNYLSRIGTGRFPNSEVVLIDCELTSAVAPVGWQFQGGREGNEQDPANVHFWEFNSHDAQGKPVDFTFRLPGSKRLDASADAATIANYRQPAYVLGNDWNPKAAPIFGAPLPAAAKPEASAPKIEVPPQHQLALLGTSPVLSVVASAGAPGRLSYQWNRNGHPLPGATSPTLRIETMTWETAGLYTVTISNSGGRITSEPVRLTAVAPQANPAPTLPTIPDAVFDVTAFGAIGDGATDNTAAIQKAIDTAIRAGGGIVTVPAAPKPYLCGPLTLGNNLNLEIAYGATVQLLPYSAAAKPGAYPLRGGAYPNFLGAQNAHDIALTGGGTINGAGDAWWDAFRANKAMPHRPFLVRFSRCERVLVTGLTFTRSPMFHVAIGADHLTVVGITIDTPDAPNTDGLDPAGSHQLFQNCFISCGDDNIVMKPGGTFCSDITIADCAFGEGHGMSVGGQTNRGLDGMVVKNCSFDGTTSALRLKADPTEGGEVKNITYTNLTMQHVLYPIVFYSYYNKVGNPGSISGNNLTTPEKVRTWNTEPPNALGTGSMPSWKNISVSNVYSSDTRGHSILWGLPREGYLIENVRLANVRTVGGPGIEIYDASNVQFTGDTNVGRIQVANALVITRQPQSQTTATGKSAHFGVETAGPATTSPAEFTYQWSCNGQPLGDGPTAAGTVAGAKSASLTIDGISATAAGKYTVTVSGTLDGFDVEKNVPAPGTVKVSATSAAATLTVNGR